MLVQFSVKNYRSFKEKVSLNLEASSDKTFADNVFEAPAGKKPQHLLKSAAIYGANASGKSNLVKALDFMRHFVVMSATMRHRGSPIPVVPFRLDDDWTAQPSEFEVVFLLDEKRYVYGFAATRERIQAEWLTVADKGTRMLFERNAGEPIKFGADWKGERKKLEELTRANALFLSVAAQFNHPVASRVHAWFRNLLWIYNEKLILEKAMSPVQAYQHDTSFAQFLHELIRKADIGIEDFAITEHAVPADRIAEARSAYLATFQYENLTESDDLVSYTIKARHLDPHGKSIHLDLYEEESDGTYQLFMLSAAWYQALQHPHVFVIDELDTHLHPNLMRMLVQLMHQSPASQLIFTTHDSSLLNADLFRRDQIWFTEKDRSGTTDLYSLWDFKARTEENYQLGYLKGRYGAIPFIGDLNFG